jgi:hypothetical protein
MIALASARVGVDAAKKGKARKKLSAQLRLQKIQAEQQADETLKAERTEAFKSIAMNYIKSQEMAVQEQKDVKQKEKEKNIQIAVIAGIGIIFIGVIAYKLTNK